MPVHDRGSTDAEVDMHETASLKTSSAEETEI